MTAARENWIKKGYEIFAMAGDAALKVEAMARQLYISKSSFYHHFADMEIFIGQLCAYHLQQSAIIAEKERNATTIAPGLVRILVDHKTDLLFNRQLRIHQQVALYGKTLEQSNRIIGNEFISIWVKDLGLTLGYSRLEALFGLALENFFLRINSEHLNEAWLTAYFDSLKKTVRSFE